ncbi:hypothetical protein [Lyngbya sp. PCC 8106]|uniref:hypothetical protein n=1 Tax=Lyngbya sp. (strain PCC 8106) TaxID=313612 RepID=UPI000586539B|nr:hypothetical protein [Lyngbya sp. PCC 8106]
MFSATVESFRPGSTVRSQYDTVEREVDIDSRTFSGLESKQGHQQSDWGEAEELVLSFKINS